jgi:uncharacterized glyoxalase superfamily protein PhnB
MANVLALKPFIPSGPDFARALAFFRDLGFTTAWESDGYAELCLGNAAFILQSFHDQHVQNNLMIFVAVDDLDDWHRHILASGVIEKYGVLAKPPARYPWGQREVHLIDPAGVCWHFA